MGKPARRKKRSLSYAAGVPASRAADAGISPAAASGATPNGSEKPSQICHWVFNPWRANWRRPLAALSLILAIALLAGYSFTTPNWWPQIIGWGGVSFLLLFGMTATIYLPVRYKLDVRGVTTYFLGVPTFRGWEHYRNFYAHQGGVHLTTMPRPSALDPFRGHFLQFGPPESSGNRETVIGILARHIRRDVVK